MKKWIIAGIVLIAVLAVLGCLYEIGCNKRGNYEPQAEKISEITSQEAVEIVKKTLDKKSIETITNYDNPKVEEVVFDSLPSIGYFGEKTDIVGKSIYKITFNTTVDGLLGPIVVYVDKSNGELIGTDFRE